MGEHGHKFEEIYVIPSIERWVDISNQQDFGAASKGRQLEASEDLR